MADSMIDRVAKALRAGMLGKELVAYEEAARIAIEAMREPMDAMIDSAWAVLGEDGDGDVAVIYAVMIDAALNEQVSG